MSHRSDQTKLIRRTVALGCTVLRLNNGHWRLLTPTGEVIIASFSPSTAGGVRATQRRLRKAGVPV